MSNELVTALQRNKCAICGVTVFGFQGGVPVYYCETDYTSFKDDILNGIAWVKYLYREEKNRRRRRARLWKRGAVVEVPLTGEL